MAFDIHEEAAYVTQIEEQLWSRRRPPVGLRQELREGQRITGHSIELFFVRPRFQAPGEFYDDFIAKLTYVRTRKVWKIFWMRADLKWHSYKPCPEVDSLAAALQTIDEDAYCCFFG